MGFLKRLFSIGGKKNSKSKHTKGDIGFPMPNSKRNSAYATVAGAPYSRSSPALQEIGNDEEDHEAAVHRLLRTSSARYAVTHEVNNSEIPPMPHPIHAVVSAYAGPSTHTTGYSTLMPSASTVSLASSTISSRGNGTYNVKVYRKERLSQGPEEVLSMETKKKNRESTHLNANDSRMLKLRSEPSVVSLVSLYDDQGRLPDEIFSNDVDDAVTPKRRYQEVPMAKEEDDEIVAEGRAQCKRSGSTLRQLLGASTNKPEDASEGDISWAERFLGELDNSSTSTHSSFMLPNPVSDTAPNFAGEISVMTEDMTVDDPAISSMDVELSISTSASEIFGEDTSFAADARKTPSHEGSLPDAGRTPTNKPLTLSYKSSIGPGGATPQKRASQVFEFIKKRASKFVEKDERNLPDPPMSAFSTPSSDTHTKLSLDAREPHGQDSNDEREVNAQLTSQCSEDSCESAFAKEKISRIPVYADEHRTPSKPKRRPVSAAVDTTPSGDGTRAQMKGMIKRFSFNLGSRESVAKDEEHERGTRSEDAPHTAAAPYSLPIVAETPMRPTADADAAKAERDIRVLMTGPTKVIVTAPTPGTANHTQTGYSLSKIPRGPRGPNSRRRTSGNSNSEQTKRREEREERRKIRQERAEREASKKERAEQEKYRSGLTTTMISTPRKKVSTKNLGHRANSSVSSTGSNENENARPAYNMVYAEAKRFVEGGEYLRSSKSKGTGESGSLGVKSEIPMTPLRVSRRMSVNQEAFFQPPPSPAARSGKVTVMAPQEEGREERRRPRGERALYARTVRV